MHFGGGTGSLGFLGDFTLDLVTALRGEGLRTSTIYFGEKACAFIGLLLLVIIYDVVVAGGGISSVSLKRLILFLCFYSFLSLAS